MEKIKFKKELLDAKAPPSFRSKAERQLQKLRERKALPENQIQLMELATTGNKKRQEASI